MFTSLKSSLKKDTNSTSINNNNNNNNSNTNSNSNSNGSSSMVNNSLLHPTKPVVKNLAEGEAVPMDEKPKSELIKGVLKKNG